MYGQIKQRIATCTRIGDHEVYKKIVIPLDGAELAEVVLPYAGELASRLKTELSSFRSIAGL